MNPGLSSTSNGGEGWNNLYYQNLGIENPETVETRVVQRLGDFRFYLQKAEDRMSRKKYNFTFRIQSVRGSLIPENNDERRDPFEAGFLSFDPEGKETLPEGSIKKDKNEVTFEGGRVVWTIFAHFKERAIPFSFRVGSVVLSDIKSLNIREEEEDAALDFLSESDSLRSGKDRIKIIRNLVRRESKLIVGKSRQTDPSLSSIIPIS